MSMPMSVSTNMLITGGRLMDPGSDTGRGLGRSPDRSSDRGPGYGSDRSIDALRDLLFVNGKVAGVGEPGSLAGLAADAGAERIDATGLVVAPGLIDLHVHLREPGQTWKETIASGTRAAAAGGFTTVCAMPNTVPVTDTAEWVRWVQAPERGAAIRVLPVAAATVGSMGEALTDYPALRDAGAVSVTDDGKPIGTGLGGSAIMRQALAAAARAGLCVTQHAEDMVVTSGAGIISSMNAGALAFRMGLRGMPVEAESSIVERDIALLRELRGQGLEARLHVQHVSTAKALDAVRAGKREGLRVTCEVMPHHFVLNENALAGYNTNAKMNPPLRSEADRAAMLEGLLDGSVDCLATDHAPHAQFEKEQEFERAPNGITGLETAFGLALRVLHGEHGMPLMRVLALFTAEPARVFGLAGRGSLAPGAWADAVIFDPAERWTFHADASCSKSKNTPFDGWAMQGAVRWTISEGRVAYAAGQEPR